MRARVLTMVGYMLVLHASLAIAASGPYEEPDASGATGLFTVPRAGTIAPGTFGVGVFYECIAREEGASNVERGGLTFTYGVIESLEVFASFEPRVGVKRDFIVEDALGIPRGFTPPLNDHPFSDEHFQDGVGDLRVGAKLRLFGRPGSYDAVALAGIIKLPTGDDDEGIGTGKADYGLAVIGSLEAAELIGFNGFLGYDVKGDPDNLAIADEMRWGLGIEVPTRTRLRGIVELTGVNYRNAPAVDFGGGMQDYALVQGGVRFALGKGVSLGGGVNRTLTIDDPPFAGVDSLERVGSFLQISYTSPPEYAEEVANSAPILSCRAEATSTRRGESVRLFAEARDPDGDVVTTRWSATAGTISPAVGTIATWSSAGIGPGSAATISATASDGRGESVTCTLRIAVDAPPAPPTATVRRFECDDFVAGSARLDNRCKAVLDDVAVNLRSQPRATVRITGRRGAGAAEERRPGLAGERAENARRYLMETHSLDPVRIEVDLRGGERPGGGGAEDRRIDLVLSVP